MHLYFGGRFLFVKRRNFYWKYSYFNESSLTKSIKIWNWLYLYVPVNLAIIDHENVALWKSPHWGLRQHLYFPLSLWRNPDQGPVFLFHLLLIFRIETVCLLYFLFLGSFISSVSAKLSPFYLLYWLNQNLLRFLFIELLSCQPVNEKENFYVPMTLPIARRLYEDLNLGNLKR